MPPFASQQRQVNPQPPNVGHCNLCGKNHGNRPCLANQNVCYFCQQPGHFANNCPQRTFGARQSHQGQIFAMSHEVVPEMDKGIFFIPNIFIVCLVHVICSLKIIILRLA